MINVNNVDYVIVELKYENSVSKLYKCKYLDKFYAIKCYRKKYIKRWKNEILFFDDISPNKNVINLINYCSHTIIKGELYYPMVFEYSEYGDLFEVINKLKMDKSLVISIFNQILNGVNHLNKHGWAHRDIKMENILVTNLNPIQVKVIDFEYATKNKYSKFQTGTLCYMSPEILKNEKYNTMKNDVWALGIILFTLYTGKMPYKKIFIDDKTNYICEWFLAIREKKWINYWLSIENCCKNIIDKSLLDDGKFDIDFKILIQKMLSWDENDRISLTKVINHPFLNNKVCNKEKPSCLCCTII